MNVVALTICSCGSKLAVRNCSRACSWHHAGFDRAPHAASSPHPGVLHTVLAIPAPLVVTRPARRCPRPRGAAAVQDRPHVRHLGHVRAGDIKVAAHCRHPRWCAQSPVMATPMRPLQTGTIVPVAGISFRQDVATTPHGRRPDPAGPREHERGGPAREPDTIAVRAHRVARRIRVHAGCGVGHGEGGHLEGPSASGAPAGRRHRRRAGSRGCRKGSAPSAGA